MITGCNICNYSSRTKLKRTSLFTLALNIQWLNISLFPDQHFILISDTVTACTVFYGEIKQWIPDEKRIELNGYGLLVTGRFDTKSFRYKVSIRTQEVKLRKNSSNFKYSLRVNRK